MKILKIILLVVVLVIIGLLVTALFTKKSYSVNKTIVINKPKNEVFQYIKLLKNQDNFSKWATMDAAMKKTYQGTDGTIGFISAWESENGDVGVGEQEIKKIVEGDRLEMELRFKKPSPSVSQAFMTTVALNDSTTTVNWGFDGNMPYPTNLILVFMDLETMIGNDLQYGLDKLKVVLEKK